MRQPADYCEDLPSGERLTFKAGEWAKGEIATETLPFEWIVI